MARQALGDRTQQPLETLAAGRRDPDRGRLTFAVTLDTRHVIQAVDLVVHPDLGQIAGTHLSEHGVDLIDTLLAPRIAGVDHMEQQSGLARLGEGRTERRDKFVRQLTDEPDGVGEDDGAAARQIHAPHQRIEGREQLVGDVGLRAGEGSEQGRLAGIGVTDERD